MNKAYRVAVDTGGTFSDIVVVDEKGELYLGKTPSTPEDPGRAVISSVEDFAMHCNAAVSEILSKAEMFAHGTTVATNAVLTGKGAKAGLICTTGFRDILYMGDGHNDELYNLKQDYPRPYVPRYLTVGVEERIDYLGNVLKPLKEDDVLLNAMERFKKYKVEAVAVSLLWSFINPSHEKRIAEIFKEKWSEIPVSISSEVQAIMREWPRTCATVLNASLGPLMGKYLSELGNNLSSNGFKHSLLIVQSTGGLLPYEESVKRPVYTLLSGPAMGPIAGSFYGKMVGAKNVITIDMGGTSFDVSLITEGFITKTREERVANIPTGVSTVEINTIGAGGGSIAWVDKGGRLHVGPQSAGAVPGPACYMRGGDQPTVTDSNIILGYLNPNYFLGGKMKISPEQSEKIIKEKVAKPLGITTLEAAKSIFQIINQNMILGIEEISVRKGFDPRKYVMVVGGGATAIHAESLARKLSIRDVIIPKAAAQLCALGTLLADIVHDYVKAYFALSGDLDIARVNSIYEELESKAGIQLEEAGVSQENIKFERYADARYAGQIWELTVPVPGGRLRKEDIETIVNNFHDAHDRQYSYCQRNQAVELLHWRLMGIGIVPEIKLPEQPYSGKDSSSARKGKRRVYFEEGVIEADIFEGARMKHGMEVQGPAVIEEEATTIVIPRRSSVLVSKHGDYYMKLAY